MTHSLRTYAVPTAVYLGSVILVGVPAFLVLTGVFIGGLEAVGLGAVADGAAGLLVVAAAFLCALQLAVEAAAVRLHGTAALRRGGRLTTVLRYVLFGTVTLAFLGVGAWFGLGATGWALERADAPTLVIGVAILLAVGVALYRGGTAFLAGYRSNET